MLSHLYAETRFQSMCTYTNLCAYVSHQHRKRITRTEVGTRNKGTGNDKAEEKTNQLEGGGMECEQEKTMKTHIFEDAMTKSTTLNANLKC